MSHCCRGCQKNMDGTGGRRNCEAGTNKNTRPAALANTLCVRTLSACRVCISHTHTRRSSGVARWVGWLGAWSPVFGGRFQLWRGGESAVAWWQGGDTSLAPPGMILVLAKKAEGGGTPPELSATPLFWHCLLYTSPSPRDLSTSRMPSSA